MERAQFTFYRSFASALRRIRKDADRAKAYDAICEYALDGKEPDFSRLPDAAAIAFDLIKPVLDTGKRKAESGKTGASAKQSGSKQQANSKQTASKAVANGKQSDSKPLARGNAKRGETVSEGEKEKEGEKEVEVEKEKENECYLSPLPPSMHEIVKNWVAYKAERREGYKPQGLTSLITEIGNNVARYGEAAVSDVIRRTMAANYRGIVFDWLKESTPRGAGVPQKKPGYNVQHHADELSEVQRAAIARMIEGGAE